ncbi:MAG: GC-type dockerin domain-anchored protein [Phycisphaerales bacterium]
MCFPHRSAVAGLIGFAAALSAGAGSYAQCDPEWSDRFALRGVAGNINAAITWNDGTGPKVYVAGDFSTFDDIPSIGFERGANSIAAWDGARWNKLGLGIGGTAMGQGGLQVVRSLAAFDADGPGPEPESLYVGGEFNWAGGQNIIGIARWDGIAWHDVGGGLFGSVSTLNNALGVRAMAVFDADGAGPQPAELYIAGDFQFAGFALANGVARWDGSQWRTVGGEFPLGTRGQKLAVFDPDGPGPAPASLYLGGIFTSVPDGLGGFLPSKGLARWDGAAWSDEPGIEMGSVNAMEVFDDGVNRSLWVSGGMSTIGGPTNFSGIARNSGGAWMQFGTPGSPPYYGAVGMAQSGNHLYLSGGFPGISESFARWSPSNPAQFEGLGSSLRGGIQLITPVDLDFAGPEPVKLLVTGGENFARFTALRDPVAGDRAFSNAAVWNGVSFEPAPTSGSASLGLGLPTNGFPLIVNNLRVLDPDGSGPQPEKLFVGGAFNGAGAAVTANAATFDGTQFGALPMWVNTSDPFNVSFFDDVSYPVVLDFATMTEAGTTSLFASSQDIGIGAAIFRWDGARFYPIGFPNSTGAQRLVAFDDGSGPALWALGAFDEISVLAFLGMTGNSVVSSSIARWRSGTGWEQADAGVPAGGFSVRDAAVHNFGSGENLYAAGFTFAFPQRYLARWTGTAWDFSAITSLAGDFSLLGSVRSFDGDLYVAGSFQSVNGVPAVSIAKWDGSTWSALGAGLTDAVNGPESVRVSSMVVHDDGTGPVLIVSGRFTHAGGVPAENIAAWNGSSWAPVTTTPPAGNGGFNASTMASYGGALYLGGSFLQWDGKSAAGLTSLARPCIPCPADFNNSGSVTVQDIFAFLTAYFSGNAAADVNGSGALTVQDIFAFLTAYFAGCA